MKHSWIPTLVASATLGAVLAVAASCSSAPRPHEVEQLRSTELIVTDLPVLERGKLPPLVAGGADIPDGLLIGTPEGMTFEYDLDDVRLLAVRLGRFAEREAASNRGEGYLKPLGQVVWLRQLPFARVPHPPPDDDCIRVLTAAQQNVLFAERVRCVFKGTWLRAGSAGLSYELRDQDGAGQVLASIDESVGTTQSSFGPAFRRSWRCRLDGPTNAIAFRLDGPMGEFDLELNDLHTADGEITHFRTHGHVTCGGTGMGAGDTWFTVSPSSGRDIVFTTTTVRVPEVTAETAARARREFGV